MTSKEFSLLQSLIVTMLKEGKVNEVIAMLEQMKKK